MYKFLLNIFSGDTSLSLPLFLFLFPILLPFILLLLTILLPFILFSYFILFLFNSYSKP